MGKSIFLFKEIKKLEKAHVFDKKEILALLELTTYLIASKEISLQDAEPYINIFISLLDRVETWVSIF